MKQRERERTREKKTNEFVDNIKCYRLQYLYSPNYCILLYNILNENAKTPPLTDTCVCLFFLLNMYRKLTIYNTWWWFCF
jgi:hypothetical protein